MKRLRAACAVVAAGSGTSLHAIAICDCSVPGCREDALASDDLRASVFSNGNGIDESAHGFYGTGTDLDLVFNGSSGSTILVDWFCLHFSEELEPDVDLGFDFYTAFAMQGVRKRFQMDPAFDFMADRDLFKGHPESKYVGTVSMGRSIDFQIYAVANTIAWTLAFVSTRLG